ncbi:MAG: hypothetical protein GC134_05050 [Proteobacteria bacterium]|nr:hypothetical protein [Pseudomonadota bacterium]
MTVSALPSRKERTTALALTPNTHRGQELVSRYNWSLAPAHDGPSIKITIALVPDRDVPVPGAVEDYLKGLNGQTWDSLEHLCATLLEDISDTLVPLLTFVEAERPAGAGLGRQVALARKTQPAYTPTAFIESLLRG